MADSAYSTEHRHYAFRQAQRGECVEGGRRESDRVIACGCSRCRVECDGDQVSTGDERRPQVIYVIRIRTGIDGGQVLMLVLVKVQLKKEIGRPQRDDVSCCSNLFGRVLWNTRRQSQLESEPCEAVRSTRGGADPNQGWTYSPCECADGKDAQKFDGCVGGERCEPRFVHFQETNAMTHLDTGKVELGFMSWLDVNDEDVKQLEYRTRLCRKEIKLWDSTGLERFHEHVMFFFTAMTWRSGVSRSLARKIMSSDV